MIQPEKMTKTPTRTCVGCKSRKAKVELIRITSSHDGALLLDAAQKLPGRGAYLCADVACLTLASKKRAFDRAFRRTIPAKSYAQFLASFEQQL
jgi:hypothetical protein